MIRMDLTKDNEKLEFDYDNESIINNYATSAISNNNLISTNNNATSAFRDSLIINKDYATSALGQLGRNKLMGGEGSKTSTTNLQSPEAVVEKNKV